MSDYLLPNISVVLLTFWTKLEDEVYSVLASILTFNCSLPNRVMGVLELLYFSVTPITWLAMQVTFHPLHLTLSRWEGLVGDRHIPYSD